MHKDTQVFIDSRPDGKQAKILPALADAIRQQRIQCLIAPALKGENIGFLARLPHPHGHHPKRKNVRVGRRST